MDKTTIANELKALYNDPLKVPKRTDGPVLISNISKSVLARICKLCFEAGQVFSAIEIREGAIGFPYASYNTLKKKYIANQNEGDEPETVSIAASETKPKQPKINNNNVTTSQIRLSKEDHIKLKLFAVKNGLTLHDVLLQAVSEYIDKHEL